MAPMSCQDDFCPPVICSCVLPSGLRHYGIIDLLETETTSSSPHKECKLLGQNVLKAHEHAVAHTAKKTS